jgi:hypothetical protein
MRTVRPFALLAASLLVATAVCAEINSAVSAIRDPQALALLQAAANAMGGVVPNDSVATGTVTIVAGSETSQGTIKILTRGSDQTSVQITTQDDAWTEIYSKGQASRAAQNAVTPYSQELASTSQSAYFPLALIGAILQDPDAAYQHVSVQPIIRIPVTLHGEGHLARLVIGPPPQNRIYSARRRRRCS